MKDMLGRDNAVTSGEALELLLRSIPDRRTATRSVLLEDSLGMVCAEEITAADDLPAFDRSTVDGYAVRAADTFGASETMPAYLRLQQEIMMGEAADFSLAAGGAAKIPTGGMLPQAADAVVMFEHIQVVDGTMIEVMKPVSPAENVIHAGEDLKTGELLLQKGRRVRPQDIGAYAGIGITRIKVYSRPVVSIISTGDEIVPAEAGLAPGRIRDTNSYVIAGMVSEAGGIPKRKGIFRDDYDTIRTAIEDAMKDSDAIAVSGGTSVGTKDMIARVIQDIGGPGVLFHGVSLKPGKPMIGGSLHGIPIFGLPGHPAAVGICFELFIRPMLHMLSGLEETAMQRLKSSVQAKLSRNVSSSGGREEHIRVMLEEREDGLWAVPILGKSGLIRTLLRADGTIVIPALRNGLEKGSDVTVRLF